MTKPVPVGFRSLTKVGDLWFTQYPKQGECMDTCEPEFAVTKIEEVTGGPETFTTTEGDGFFFKYGIKEVEQIAPTGANAYYLPGDVTRGGLGFITPIQFFHIEADTSRRLRRESEVNNNLGLLMDLLEKDNAA